MRKNRIHTCYFLLLLSALVLLNSCSLKRNLYLNGLTLWHSNGKSKKAELEKFMPVQEKEVKESVVVKTPEKMNSNEATGEKVLIPKKIIPSLKKYFSERKYFSSHPKKEIPGKPANSKFKVSVSQINTMAFISFLFVPIFIASLFTSSALFIISSFCIGVILATICGFLADGRKGCWLVGIAIGFWIVVVGYMALLLFVF